jgi:hypothetical protein
MILDSTNNSSATITSSGNLATEIEEVYAGKWALRSHVRRYGSLQSEAYVRSWK